MKKKIAVFSVGCSNQILGKYMKGIKLGTEDISVDVYLFLCFASATDGDTRADGELNIFNLPNLNDFDGALVLGSSINTPRALEEIDKRCKEANIPVIYTGYKTEDGYFVGIDNYYGAKQLCEHLYNDHGIRDFFFVAGSKGNMDSNMRLKAFQDVLSKNGSELSEDKYFYTDWSPRAAMLFIEEWLANNKKLPEAFVCANDELAVIVCEKLRKNGIIVPDDVIVTGFDNVLYGQVYDPSISSVSQQFDKIGYESARMLLDLLDGKVVAKERIINCKFIPGKSCGCTEGIGTVSIRKDICRNRFMDDMFNSAFYSKLSIMERQMMKGTSYDDIRNNYKVANDMFNYYEGKSYHIVLDPLYRAKITNLETEYEMSGYPEKMDVFFSLDEGNYACYDNFDVRQIVPQVSNPEENHLFVCAPLHDEGARLGYIVFADDYEKVETSLMMGTYTERLSLILVRFQQAVYAKILKDKLSSES